MIYAQHGTKRAPHIFFRVEADERYSVTLDKHMAHQTLRIGYNYSGPTEIGGLILLPEYRRNTDGLGKALSYVRFLFMRMHREMFRNQVLSELLPPLEADGTSKLWEALGRKFTGLSYQEADLVSKDNKEFHPRVVPRRSDPRRAPSRTTCSRSSARSGPETRPVEAMLRKIGFDYAEQIDPFDGGPHFVANTDQITIVRDSAEVEVKTVDAADTERPWAVLAVHGGTHRPPFRAISTRVIPMENGGLGITAEARQRLGVEDGQKVWRCFG